MTTRKHRVWIELDRPAPGEEGDEQAALLSKMLVKLGYEPRKGVDAVWWHDKKRCFCFTLDAAGGYVEAGDNGHWFNLDYFAA